MKLKRVVVLADPASRADLSLFGLEQLGLQMCDQFSPDADGSESLVFSAARFADTLAGSTIIRQALDRKCTVVLDSGGLSAVIDEIKKTGNLCEETRQTLAAGALYKCLESDARLLAKLQSSKPEMPRYVVKAYEKVQDLRYGENWHQKAALLPQKGRPGTSSGKQAQWSGDVLQQHGRCRDRAGDAHRPRRVRRRQGPKKPLSVIVKHANPCGVAYGNTLQEAYRLSFATDPKSAFGGVIGFGQPVDVDTAQAIGNSFVEVLLAPGFEPEALKILTENKPNRRVLDIGDLLQKKG